MRTIADDFGNEKPRVFYARGERRMFGYMKYPLYGLLLCAGFQRSFQERDQLSALAKNETEEEEETIAINGQAGPV
jgi:hypothetical protein